MADAGNNRDKVCGRKPKIGVVIGGGGLKCLSAVCLFEFLNENNIDVDLMVGCSGGAIMSALYGAGYNSAQMRDAITQSLNKKLFSSLDLRSIAGIAGLPFGRFDKTSGIIKSAPIRQMYRRIFGDRMLEDLKPETILQTTDYQTGDSVILSKGLVADAVYASGVWFPILPPICIEGRWFIDGSYNSHVPVMEAVKRNMDIIIVMMFEEKLDPEPQGFINCYYNVNNTMTRALDRSQMSMSIDLGPYEIVMIDVVFDKVIPIWGVDEVPGVLEAGQKAVDRKKEEILMHIQDFGMPESSY
jgi:NTE family protein